MLKKMILVTLVTLPIAALLVWKSPEEKQLLPESPALLTVESVQAVNNLWDNSLSVRGPLTAWQEAIVSAEINGLAIKAIHVDIGDSVKQGQLLAQLNDATLRAELDQTQAQVDTATSHLSEAKNDITRAQRLEKTKAISAQQLEQFDIALQLAQARFRSAKARQQLSQIKLKQTRIVAIDDGVISARSVNLGEVISAGQEIFRLIRQNRVEWRAELDSEQVFQVNPGMTSRLSLTNGIEIEGVVRQVSPSLNSQTRMAIAYIDLPLHPSIRPGDYVSGNIQIGKSPALTLPAKAITWRDGRSLIFEVKASTVSQREVVIGRMRGDLVEILNGISSDMSIVLNGAAFLNDGDQITELNSKHTDVPPSS